MAKMKYGPKNCQVSMEGSDIVVRVDSGTIIGRAGDLKPAKKNRPVELRMEHLIGTSGGFTTIGPCKVSINVTQPPDPEEMKAILDKKHELSG